MSFDVERLFSLLPAIYRNRDAELARRAGFPDDEGPLKALVSLIAEQVEVLEDDLAQLYDDQFIETCAEWVVPYIGDLVGARGLFVFTNAPFSQRALVANTVAARRRKGTAAALEEVARDAGGWNTYVAEYFSRLATTQYMNHRRLDNVIMPDLRDAAALRAIGTPFDPVARTFEARRIQTGRGRYNIPNVGVHVWRLQPFSVTGAPAFVIDSHRHCFDPRGRDRQLMTKPEPETGISHRATPINVPEPIDRATLADDVQPKGRGAYYGKQKSVLLTVNGRVIPSTEIQVCNLEDIGYDRWNREPDASTYIVDPELGRLITRQNEPDADVRVSYEYTFSAPLGGGEYARQRTFSDVRSVITVVEPASIQSGLDAAAGRGAVEIEGSARFVEAPVVVAADNAAFELRAADNTRPTLYLTAPMTVGGGDNGEVTLNGLWIFGGLLHVPRMLGPQQPNRLRTLRLRHCTLVPGPIPPLWLPGSGSAPTIPAQVTAPRLHIDLPGVVVEIDRCIVGGVRAVGGSRVRITNSIVDAGLPSDVAFAGLLDDDAGARLTAMNTTVIGKVRTELIELASNTIFFSELARWDWWEGPVIAERLQQGCVRYSYVPPGSRVPRRYRCQPATAADDGRVRPVFTSLEWGEPGYCQLSGHTARDVAEGADDQSEMGAFHDVYQPQRLANVRARIDEYLRFGLEGGTLFAS